MRVRSICAALVAAPTALVGALVAAPSADAAAECYLHAPSKVSISRPYTQIPLRASGACSYGFAAWDGVHSYYGPQLFAYFDGTSTDNEPIYDWEYMGRYVWQPSGAYGQDYDELTQNSPSTTIKYASWSYIGTARSGSKVTLKAQVNKYSADASRQVPYNSARLVFQMRAVGASNWHTVATRTADSRGKASVTYTQSAKRQYRVATTEIGSLWGSNSSTATR